MSTDVTDILRTTDLLGSASAADLEAIAAASRSRTFRRGQILFTAGDPSNTLIVVISGRVKVVVRSADGGELTLTVIAPGGVFGELSVADGGPRSADAETLEDCRLLFVPREVIQDLCGRAPSVAQALASSLAASLRRLTEEASDLVFLDLPRRVAKVLLSQPRADDGVIGQKMTQEEFAHRVGGARQSVNAALRGFERRGWIQVRNQAVTVKQAAALSRFAGDLPAHAKRPPCGQSREAHQAQNVHPGSFGMKVLNFAAGRRITARRDEAAVARREQRRSSLTNEARPTARGARGWLSDSPDARVAAHRQEEAGTRGARGL